MKRREFLAGLPLFWRSSHVSMAGISFRVLRGAPSPHRYLHIHGSEPTAREVIVEQVKAHGGIALLIDSDTRNVAIAGGKIDPNRMFSRIGAVANLEYLNSGWNQAQIASAAALLDRDRPKLLRALSPPKVGRIVALHNNSSAYSVIDEITISDKTSIKDPTNPHEFFLATDVEDFDRLTRSPYNVVLQHSTPDDDGSLSRLAARVGIRYVNLECRLGNIERQREMLGWLERNL